MNFADGSLDELKAQFVRNGADQLGQIARLLEVLEQNPAETDQFLLLRRCFYNLANLSGTLGLARITSISQMAGQLCNALLKDAAPVKGVDLSEWHRLLEALRVEFAEEFLTISLARQEEKSADSSLEDFRILVIGEDKQTGTMLSHLLEKEELRIHEVRTRKEAMSALAHHLPDGIILDACLPDGMGYELVEYVRNLPNGDQPVIIMISALDGFLDKVEAIRCGADGYYEKPVDWEAFMRRFTGLLARNKPIQARILAVESDYEQAAFLQALLEPVGYQVLICSNPQFFELVLAAFRPDLILMDAALPGITGYELVRYLRQSHQYAMLPVLFLAEQKQQTGRLESARAGGDDFLAKPVDPELLLALIGVRLERMQLLKSQMERDSLTRLLNHTSFFEKARSVVETKKRNPLKTAALIITDMDQFSVINDRYSHLAGDRVLTAFANFLRKRLRQSDILARYGGEEFALIVTDLSRQDAVRLTMRLMEEFSIMEHRAPDGSVFNVTFSAGLAMLEADITDLEDWKQAAITALREASASGRKQLQYAEAGCCFTGQSFEARA